MKVTPEEFAALEAAIKAMLDLKAAQAKYKEEGRSHERFRWDVFHHVKGYALMNHGKVGGFPDYNDSHIDTALKRILGANYS